MSSRAIRQPGGERGDPVGITVISRDCFSLDKLGIAMTLLKQVLRPMKKTLSRLLASKSLFFMLATIVILTLNLIPLVTLFRHSPPGRTFLLTHNNVQDFFFYQSLMNKGASGDWLTSDPYTSEAHQPSVIFAYFAWLGKLSHLLAIPYVFTYHLVRLVLGILCLLSAFSLLIYLRLPYPRLTFLFFIFGGAFMHQTASSGKIVSIPYMNWWTGMDAIRRVAYLPHHMFGSLFLILSVFLIIKYMRQPRLKYLIFLGVFAALLAFVHTPSLFIILLALPPALILNSIFSYFTGKNSKFKSQKSNQTQNSNIIGLLGYWVIGLFFMLLMLAQTNRGFPWSQYIEWERKLQFPLAGELFGAFGILLPFAILGIVYAFRSKRFEYLFTVSWFVTPLLLIPFAQKLNLSNIRLIQGTPYLPLSILAVLGIKALQEFIQFIIDNKSKIQNPCLAGRQANDKSNPNVQNSKNLRLSALNLGFSLIIGILFLTYTLPTLTWSIKDQIREYWPIYGNVYLDNRLNNAFAYINRNFPPNTLTLSTFYSGNFLPAFTHTTSFIGHFGYTYQIDRKKQLAESFFANKMTEKEAKDFLLDNKITLVYQGPEEKPMYNNYLYPKLLKPVYDREEATLYIIN
ncbi:hypothetical protein MUP32_03320 [Candidatus Microgenomates bacterium]|nr:hypothetical protein [Candidatus Microgenomates bacterium]